MRRVGKSGKMGVLVLWGLGLIAACAASSEDTPSPSSELEGDASVIGAATCSEIRKEGAECTLPEGTSCIQGACGEQVFVCRRGVWVAYSVVLSGTCPESAPTAGDPCSPCFPVEMTCDFGTDCENGATPVRARCLLSSWITETLACADAGGAEDAAGEASSDAESADSEAMAP